MRLEFQFTRLSSTQMCNYQNGWMRLGGNGRSAVHPCVHGRIHFHKPRSCDCIYRITSNNAISDILAHAVDMAATDFTPEERIRELSAINGDVAEMLKQAGQAINALTNRPLGKGEDEDGDEEMADDQHTPSSSERQDAFQKHTAAFYTGVQSVVARLRRNVYGLEEAGIILAETTAPRSEEAPKMEGVGKALQAGKPPKEEASKITNGGMGNLDVGWLNSKGNKVGAEKENELMEEARELLEDELNRRDKT